jgi:VIT1/CCC1 family predicted Fe2+/Mn2+ transporter
MVNAEEISGELRKKVREAQRDEITEHHFYAKLARSVKDKEKRRMLDRISKEEMGHYQFWKEYTEEDVSPNTLKIWLYLLSYRLFGITFAMKRMEGDEERAQDNYEAIANSIPEAKKLIEDESFHERSLVEMIDERRLNYTGAVVRGLNDGIVEITGEVAGLSLVLQNPALIGVIAFITGVAGALALASSEYLAASWDEGPQTPLGSAAYTIIAYIITITFLIFPYILLNDTYLSLILVIINATILILILNYQLAIAKSIDFRRRASEMLAISLGIAALSFVIGFFIREFLHIGI